MAFGVKSVLAATPMPGSGAAGPERGGRRLRVRLLGLLGDRGLHQLLAREPLRLVTEFQPIHPLDRCVPGVELLLDLVDSQRGLGLARSGGREVNALVSFEVFGLYRQDHRLDAGPLGLLSQTLKPISATFCRRRLVFVSLPRKASSPARPPLGRPTTRSSRQ